jgi:hypothetical protein
LQNHFFSRESPCRRRLELSRIPINPPFCADNFFYWEMIGVYAFNIYYVYGFMPSKLIANTVTFTKRYLKQLHGIKWYFYLEIVGDKFYFRMIYHLQQCSLWHLDPSVRPK